MKNTYLTLMLFFISQHAYSQPMLICSVVTDEMYRDSLYSTCYNTLRLETLDHIPFERLQMKCDSADIIKWNGFHIFNVRVMKRVNSIKLRIYDCDRLLDTREYYVSRNMPEPQINFCAKPRTLCGVGFPKKPKCLIVNIDNINGIVLKTLAYIVEIESKGNITYSEFVTGESFPETFYNAYGKCYLNDAVIFRSIIYSDEIGNIHTIPYKRYVLF